MRDHVGSPDIILVWPSSSEVRVLEPSSGYSVQSLPSCLDSWWIDIHRLAVPSFGISDLNKWLARYRSLSLPNGILIATHDATGEPVATAGSIAHSQYEMLPDGGQLAWVATAPKHRGRGLASWLGSLATARLQQDGFKRIFVCTGDDMLQAISVYLRLGYLPYLYASDQRERWQRISLELGCPFEPENWQLQIGA